MHSLIAKLMVEYLERVSPVDSKTTRSIVKGLASIIKKKFVEAHVCVQPRWALCLTAAISHYESHIVSELHKQKHIYVFPTKH